jgi:hypothetical protein
MHGRQRALGAIGAVVVCAATALPDTDARGMTLAEPSDTGSVFLATSSPPQGSEAFAGRRWREPPPRQRSDPDSYVLLKGGGLRTTDDAASTGLYTGIELGGTVEDVIDFGLSVDYFHRSTSEMLVLGETQANGLPVRAEATLEESAAHLIPIGLTMRVHVPLATKRVMPFVSGTLAYEVLILENNGTLDPSDPLQGILLEEETFHGFGWQATAGVDIGVSPSVGLYGEVGLHRSSPQQEIELDGLPVDLKVDMHGGFLRAGLRVAL